MSIHGHGPHILCLMNEKRYIHQFFYLDHLIVYWQQKIKNLESHNRTEMEERPCPQHQPVWTRDQWRPLAVERRPPRRWNQLRTARGGLINNYNDIAFSSVLLHISCSVTTTVKIFLCTKIFPHHSQFMFYFST